MLCVRTPLRRNVLDKTLSDDVCQCLATGRWFSQGTPFSSTSNTYHHDMHVAEIIRYVNALLKSKPKVGNSQFKDVIIVT
jgi:hypothetical protein